MNIIVIDVIISHVATWQMGMRIGRRILMAMLLGVMPHCASYAAVPMISIVISEESRPYLETANAIKSALETEFGVGLKTRIIARNDIDWDLFRNNALAVTVGVAATQKIALSETKIPILVTLVPRQTFEQLAHDRKRPEDYRVFSSIYLDQPIARQFRLIRVVLPESKSAGVIVGPATLAQLDQLKYVAEKADLRLVTEKLTQNGELFSALQRLLPEVDLLFTLPDPTIVNPSTIQNLLLTTYRYRVPVISYSQSYVDAGALAAVYSSPEQIGSQAARIIKTMAKSGAWILPKPQYPEYFSVKINRNVARSLGLILPEETVALQQLIAAVGEEL